MATTAELQVVIKAQDQASKVIQGMAGTLKGLGDAVAAPIKAVGGLTSALGTIGLAAQGIEAVAGAAKGLGGALGVGLASQMEQVTARFNAFTKDSAQTEKILAQVREEANKTPFVFQEMANAAAMLLPASKQATGGLMGLIKEAEILAALNPSEGLEGAAFALREALSGDFVSVMERFNIPRELINRLKAEGVPAAQIVGRALEEMGADFSLVSNLANTTEGRLSTFQDALDGVRIVAGQPILEALGRALDRFAGALAANQEPLRRFAQTIGDLLARAVELGTDALFGLIQAVERVAPVFDAFGRAALAAVHGDFASAMAGVEEGAAAAGDVLRDVFGGAVADVQDALSAFAPTAERLGDAFEVVREAAADAARGGLAVLQRGVEEVLDVFGGGEGVLQSAAEAINGVTAAAEEAYPVLTALGDAFAAVGATVVPLTGQFADYLIQQGLVSERTQELTGNTQRTSAVMDALWAVLRATPIGQVVDALQTLVAQIQSAQAATGELASGTQAAWQAMIAAAGAVRDGVVAKLEEVAAYIRSLPARFQADAVATGAAIVSGMVAGMNPARVIAAGHALGVAAMNAAKSALGVSSPSKEFEEIGEEIVAGLVDGVEDNGQEAVDAAADLAAEVTEAAAAANVIDALLGGLDDRGDEALAHFVRDAERLQDDVAARVRAIGEKAAEAAAEARSDAAEALEQTGERALEQIQDLLGRRQLDRETDGRRDALKERQDEEARARKDRLEDEELEYRFQRDLAKAKTDDDRREVAKRFEEQRRDLARRRGLEEDERRFRQGQEDERRRLERTLEDEALERSIARIQKDRDERVRGITEALEEKLAKITENEAEEREELARSADQKLRDLKERFYDKVGPLTDAAKEGFEELFRSLAEQVGDATKAVVGLAEALARVSGARVAAPVGLAGGDGATWENQPQSVRDMFTAAHGASARQVWQEEHAREIGALANVPQPTGYDPTSGLPTGPGYFEPVPMTEYWQNNWDRFNPLPYGTEYPPEAFYGSDQNSRDVFGGNNTASEDAYATGGVVPGPYGAPRRAIVHGGEAVFTPDQLAALARYAYGGAGEGGGDAGYWQHSHDIVLDGVLVGRAVTPYVTSEQDRFASIRVR